MESYDGDEVGGVVMHNIHGGQNGWMGVKINWSCLAVVLNSHVPMLCGFLVSATNISAEPCSR